MFLMSSGTGNDVSKTKQFDLTQSKSSSEVGRILVVEDENEIRELIILHLKRDGHTVDEAATAEEAQNHLDTKTYDLIAVDWMLPSASGIEITKRLRRQGKTDLAVLMVTAKTEAADIVEGLEAGADDYLSKPFEPQVLLARVRALLRRGRRGQDGFVPTAQNATKKIGNLSLNPETFEASCCDDVLHLTASEFKLLVALMNSGGRVLTRDSLIQQVQGEGVSVVGRTVDTHVFGLRKKLGSCGDLIETVRGIGYRVKI